MARRHETVVDLFRVPTHAHIVIVAPLLAVVIFVVGLKTYQSPLPVCLPLPQDQFKWHPMLRLILTLRPWKLNHPGKPRPLVEE
jgi:hypothetical protein